MKETVAEVLQILKVAPSGLTKVAPSGLTKVAPSGLTKIAPSGLTLVALYVAGVSQRKPAEVMSLLLGHHYSRETVSAITDEVLEKVEAFRGRPLPAALPEGQTS